MLIKIIKIQRIFHWNDPRTINAFNFTFWFDFYDIKVYLDLWVCAGSKILCWKLKSRYFAILHPIQSTWGTTGHFDKETNVNLTSILKCYMLQPEWVTILFETTRFREGFKKNLKKTMENSIIGGRGGQRGSFSIFIFFLVPNDLKINFRHWNFFHV